MTLPFTKRHAPPQLQAWVRENAPTTDRSWEELPTEVKAALRGRLHEDQRCLCCYCYARVACDESSHIEHVEPQSSENRFDWQNLALACDGGSKHRPPQSQPHNRDSYVHCDHYKGHQRLDVVHPYKAPVIRFVSLGSTGALKMQDEAARRDVDAVLNLNAKRLQSLRRSALQSALADLHTRRNQQDWKPQRLAQSLAELQRRTTALDYQPLIEGWLERRLRRKS